jgi:Protein of unknown function (DUF2510)
MTVAPAGWYADPENAAAQRYWDGMAWAAPLPMKEPRASKRLALFARLLAAVAPLAMLGGVAMGVLSLLVASLFGFTGMQPGALAEGLVRWAASGAQFSIPCGVIAIVLAILATGVRPRASAMVIRTMWLTVGASAVAVLLVLVFVRPFDF